MTAPCNITNCTFPIAPARGSLNHGVRSVALTLAPALLFFLVLGSAPATPLSLHVADRPRTQPRPSTVVFPEARSNLPRGPSAPRPVAPRAVVHHSKGREPAAKRGGTTGHAAAGPLVLVLGSLLAARLAPSPSARSAALTPLQFSRDAAHRSRRTLSTVLVTLSVMLLLLTTGPGGLTALAFDSAVVQDVSGLLAPLLTLCLYFSPLQVAQAIVQQKQSSAYSLLPYLTMQGSCCLWTLYGLALGDSTVLLPNSLGFVVSSLTMGIYALYSTQDDRPSALLRIGGLAAALAWLYSFNFDAGRLGLIAAMLSVLLFASPLAQVANVIKRQDSSAMPSSQILFGLLSGAAWTVYGTCVGNAYILFPNALGAVLSAAQLAVFLRYRPA